MDFFSGNEIVLLIWGIGILHFIFRWMKERRSSDRSTEGTPREENGYSIPETPLPRPSSYGAGKDNDKEYNYKELRERVLRSWGMKDARSDEMDLPDEMEKSKFYGVELDSVSGRIGKLLYPESIMECSGDTENRFHQYLSKPLRERKTKPMAVEPITAPKAAQAAADWSEETVRTWAKYDVVFGEPRGRRPWTPFVRH